MFKLSKAILLLSVLTITLNAGNLINEKECKLKGEGYIYAGGECIQYYLSEGEKESEINIIVHGTWDEGTNTLGRYAPFADNISMETDITTIAVALPGYSHSSTNNFPALSNKSVKNLAANKKYIQFLSDLVTKLKTKYQAKKVNYIGHSAGAFMGSTLTGFTPGLINIMVSAGAGYDIHSKVKNSKNLISLIDYIDNIDKNIKFLLIYGTKDKISKPKVTKDYYNILKTKGYNVKLVEVVDAPHIDLDMTDTAVEAITEILEEE
ncbi:MAG: alpha/beta hydrolase [Arcobacter sp.]|nr:MAG: alpha/beta hydrolase [Arcobacter sp.]